MRVERTEIADVLSLHPARHKDDRGWLAEAFRASSMAAHGVDVAWVQENQSFSAQAGTVRALHFQKPPHAQAKLVRVVRGALFDVMVDVRKGSPTFGKSVTRTLSAENQMALFAPAGFAHGFCTLEPETEAVYLLSAEFAPDHDAGIRWNDPALGIKWPVTETDAILSAKDRALPLLSEITSPF